MMAAVAAVVVLMVVVVAEEVYPQVQAVAQEQHRTGVAEPVFELAEFLGQGLAVHRRIGNDPRQYHDGQARGQAEEHRQHIASDRGEVGRNGQVNHREEIHQPVGAEGDGEEDAEHEGPEPAGLVVHILKHVPEAVVMVVMVMTGKEQQHTADKHEHAQQRFAPFVEEVMNALGLRPHDEGEAQQHVGRQLAEDEHQSAGQHAAFVLQLAVDISDGRYAGKEGAGVENHHEAQHQSIKYSQHIQYTTTVAPVSIPTQR